MGIESGSESIFSLPPRHQTRYHSQMKPKVYIETSVISYLAAWPSRDVIVLAHQEVTRTWWEQRSRYRLFVSRLVEEEIARGDATAAAARVQRIHGIAQLDLDANVQRLTQKLLDASALPPQALEDAIHVAVCAVHRIDYLVSWNCKHIANAMRFGDISRCCTASGFTAPVICTPDLMLANEDGEHHVE